MDNIPYINNCAECRYADFHGDETGRSYALCTNNGDITVYPYRGCTYFERVLDVLRFGVPPTKDDDFKGNNDE